MTGGPALRRRTLLGVGMGVVTGGLAAPASAAVRRSSLNLADPKVALTSYVKLRGSTADETVFQVYDGDVFLIVDGQPGVPLCGFCGIQKSHWKRDGKGGFTNEDYDIGFYVDYGTREILREWKNPLTSRTVEVFHYRGGPTGGHFRTGEDGDDVYGGAKGRWLIAGDQISHSSSNWVTRPNPLTPEQWPLASSGATIYGSMSLSFVGRVRDVADPAVHMASAMQVWTNVTGWMPWMEMGQRPGYNEWRWIGAKGVRREELDPVLVAAAERVWPGYVSTDSVWRVPTSGRTDYMRLKQGQALTR